MSSQGDHIILILYIRFTHDIWIRCMWREKYFLLSLECGIPEKSKQGRLTELTEIGLLQKKTHCWGSGQRFSRGIKKICGNSRGKLKKKWKFQGNSRKSHVEFPLLLVFDLGISKACHTILQNFQGWKSSFSLEFLRVKWQI